MQLTPEQNHAARLAIVAKAQSHLGEREIGFTNTGPEVNQFLAYVNVAPGASWCMAFACFCVGRTLEGMGLCLEDSGLVKTGYCPTQADHAREEGALVTGADAAGVVRPGDLMLEWEASLSGYHHTGVVTDAPGEDGAFQTVEGNSNESGAREGYEVCRQHRYATDAASDGHPKYAFIRVFREN